MNYKKYIKSQEWKEKRQAKLEACDFKCECDGGCIREATQIHHLHYDTLGNESMEDLQALCAKCHMSKSSKVRNFYGNPIGNCCRFEGHSERKKIVPYYIWNEANSHLQADSLKYTVIAAKLKTEPIIAALLDSLNIMFACGDIQVEPKVTKAIERFVDIVSGDDNRLKGYCDVAYKIKSEFEKYFEVSKEELENARALEESRMQGLSKSTWKEK